MNKRAGFTLIELMIVVAIVAILVAIALPAYNNFVRKARRADAMQVVLDLANEQALWRSSNTTYGTYANLGSPTISHYGNPTVSNISATTFTVTTVATGGQASDKERGASCTTLVYTLNGTAVTQTPAKCWVR